MHRNYKNHCYTFTNKQFYPNLSFICNGSILFHQWQRLRAESFMHPRSWAARLSIASAPRFTEGRTSSKVVGSGEEAGGCQKDPRVPASWGLCKSPGTGVWVGRREEEGREGACVQRLSLG